MSASSHRQVVQQLMAEHGTTYASEAGITLRDKPAPLFRLLVLCQLFAAPISAGIAVRAARELFDAGWRTPTRMLDSTWQQRVDALGRAGYRRYDESTARHLSELSSRLQDAYRGDLRRLRDEAHGEADGIADRLRQFPRVGPKSAGIFCREVQDVWPSVRPYLDGEVRAGARAAGLPDDPDRLAALVDGDDLARFGSALVRVALAG